MLNGNRRVLLIEDNANLASGLRTALTLEGYQVEVASDGATGLARARAFRPSAVILDLTLPGPDDFDVLRSIRRDRLSPAVMILTARASESEKLRGFRSGADDYVTKPFDILELAARLEVLIRRTATGEARSATSADVVRFGDVEIQPDLRTVLRQGEPVTLRPMEYHLLLALVAARGAVLDRAQLLQQVWGIHADVVTRTVDIHVAELRRKLEADPARPRHLLTVRKVGYRLLQ